MSLVQNILKINDIEYECWVYRHHLNQDYYFRGEDVMDILHYVDTKKAIEDYIDPIHCITWDKLNATPTTPKWGPDEIFITEWGLYDFMVTLYVDADDNLNTFLPWFLEYCKQ